MAKKQRQDSQQERALEAKEENAGKGAVSGRHTVRWVSPREFMPGDRIVTQFKRGTGDTQALKAKTIKADELEHEPRGCRGKVHVGKECYDYVAKAPIVLQGARYSGVTALGDNPDDLDQFLAAALSQSALG